MVSLLKKELANYYTSIFDRGTDRNCVNLKITNLITM